jgi:SAM-dependent methyltransferase
MKEVEFVANEEFDRKIGRLTKSAAYLDYAEEVYGCREYLFNMMDKAQLDFLLSAVPLTQKDTLLDLGCGYGSLLRLLCEKYGCKGIGIDLLKPELVNSFGAPVTYIQGDIDKLADFELSPTVTLAVDCLYFSKDLSALLCELLRITQKRLYLYYSQYLFDKSPDRRTLHRDHTAVADVLNAYHIPYEAVDYSENERVLYEKSLAALQKRQKAFEAEGNLDLFEEKLREDTLGNQLYGEGLASRTLYIIRKEIIS